MNLTWKCEACGKTRPDAQIAVHKADLAVIFGLSPGSASRNVNYCNDTPECLDGAKKIAQDEIEGIKASKAKPR